VSDDTEDEAFEEGCPDCGNDTVIVMGDPGFEWEQCETCGWRP
jgi:ribosomal protein S27E